METVEILGIAGSLRKGSYNRALIEAAKDLAPSGVSVSSFALDDIPPYRPDQGSDQEYDAVKAFREAIESAHGVLIASPEYNYSMSGVLKNALDWGSRPAFASPFAGKKVAIMSASMGATGGVRGQQHLKTVLLALCSHVFPAPEFALGQAQNAFDERGQLTDEGTRTRVVELLERFGTWIRA